jgi:hypothetical protein
VHAPSSEYHHGDASSAVSLTDSSILLLRGAEGLGLGSSESGGRVERRYGVRRTHQRGGGGAGTVAGAAHAGRVRRRQRHGRVNTRCSPSSLSAPPAESHLAITPAVDVIAITTLPVFSLVASCAGRMVGEESVSGGGGGMKFSGGAFTKRTCRGYCEARWAAEGADSPMFRNAEFSGSFSLRECWVTRPEPTACVRWVGHGT